MSEYLPTKKICAKLFTKLIPQNPQLNNHVYQNCTAPEPALHLRYPAPAKRPNAPTFFRNLPPASGKFMMPRQGRRSASAGLIPLLLLAQAAFI